MSSVISGQLFMTEKDLSEIFSLNQPLGEALREVVLVLGNRLEVDVCSIYLRENYLHKKRATSLILAATVGLKQDCVGTLRMNLHEGLAGMVAEKLQPVSVVEAAKHPRFKYFPEAEEDAYESFLGVPIGTQGVLVVQTIEPRSYSSSEVNRLLKQATILNTCMNKD